jgi:hypothetical protein
VAEAMDTAQRGMGLDWPTSLELIRRSLDAARDHPGALLASGCGTDHLAPAPARSVDDVIRAYEEQMEASSARRPPHPDGEPRAGARGEVAGRLRTRLRPRAAQVREPVILHWLGDMFDPALKGYWGSDDIARRWTPRSTSSPRTPARSTASRSRCSTRTKEIAMRRRLPRRRAHVHRRRLQLRRADRRRRAGHSATRCSASSTPIAPAASGRAGRARQGDRGALPRHPGADVPLSRHIFRAPTRFYKTGVVFMAWLNGHQDHFVMVGGQQSTRSLPHLAELFRLAGA